MRVGAAIAAGLTLVACTSPNATPPPPPADGALATGVVARVGEDVIGAVDVGRIAARQHLSVKEARDLAIRDALFASEARARGLGRGSLDAETNLALAHALLRAINARARKTPMTDEELARGTERHWVDLDRPDAFRTAHVVVRFDPRKATPAERKRAIDLAEQIRAAVVKVTDLAKTTPLPVAQDPRAAPPDPLFTELEKDANAVPHPGFEVKVETLEPVTGDGRTFSGGQFDVDYAKGAATLAKRGDLSDVVVSSFGAHVILLLERIPGAHPSADERRRALREEVFVERAADEEKAILTPLRSKVSVERDVDALLALLRIGDLASAKR